MRAAGHAGIVGWVTMGRSPESVARQGMLLPEGFWSTSKRHLEQINCEFWE
jgi:hypothetical protein